MFLRTAAALVLACAGPAASAQTGKFGLDKLRDALNSTLPDRGQAPAPSLQASPPGGAAPAAASTAPAADPPSANASTLPDIEQWSTQLPPVSAQRPYVVQAGLRFEAHSNPCADGRGRCWVPITHLPMSGRLNTGQEIQLSYKAGGRTWFTERFRAGDATALLRDRNSVSLLYRLRSGRNQEHLARHTGRIEFEVTHVDPLEGTNRKLASGHFVVGKEATGLGGADNVDYYVSYDWATEAMTVDFMGRGKPSLDAPGLVVDAVFLQPVERNEALSLHLFHKGREIAATDSWGTAFTTSARNQKTKEGYAVLGSAWSLPNVVAYDRRQPRTSAFFVLSENPGEYTLKILRNGELAREAGFTITPEGRIDRSLNVAAHLPHGYTVLRAKVHGQQDRARANFKADGLWGAASAMK